MSFRAVLPALLLPAALLAAPPRVDVPIVTGVPWKIWTPAIPAVPPSATGATFYVDGEKGSDRNDGRTIGTPVSTLAAAVARVGPGDTVLIRKGIYREGIRLHGRSGEPGRPITFGSYGDGEVILDGSARVRDWTRVAGTVWRAQASFTPIAVVVNDTPLRQVRQGQNGSSAPQDGLAGVTGGSGKWHRGAGNLITADFGTTLGDGDPNTADVVVPNDNGAQEHVYWWESSHLVFKGLTVRGSGSNGLWGYGGNITVDSCDIKFNGKAAVSFFPWGKANTDNAVLYSRAYHNVLLNWPRGNNGYAESGGGWPGALAWTHQLRPVARGNVVHRNGGEGIISYGTRSGLPSGGAVVERNVVFDNWSVNIYFDNQPGNVARGNFVFNHPPEERDFLHLGRGAYDSLDKYSVCIMLANEQGSSDSTGGHANLRDTKVYNNVLAGCRIGIRDYAEGFRARLNHGLKGVLIANNTIVVPAHRFRSSEATGLLLSDNGSRDEGTVIVNNVIVGLGHAPLVARMGSPLRGITMDRNLYHGPARALFRLGSSAVDFAAWKAANAPEETDSRFADPLLAAAGAFTGPGPAPYEVAHARPAEGSPALGTAPGQPVMPATNIAGEPRGAWRAGAF